MFLFSNAEEEFLSLAEKLKPFAEEKMKIEPYPWFEGYFIDMDELYTELTLEKIERQLLGEETWSLQSYEDMFNCNDSEHKNRKVLMKADPGMGKTTLGRKMCWDWAKEVFNKFSIVFFVALKLVKPGDPIESVVIQQNPELEGLGVSQQKMKVLLNRYSGRILIILDGLDEHGLGQNDDVLKIIKNQKLLNCRILVSSRPHSTWEIEEYFPTVVRIDGFAEKEAKKFVSNFFADERKIQQIMQFRPSDSRENFPVHKCPILLSILCFLVNKEEIDISDTNITIGDLYFKMVQCLYKKYTIKKGVLFQESDLIEVMRSVGQLALRTLLSNDPLLQRSEVLRIAGEFALDYGFFAAEKSYTDITADIYVTYGHRSLEEFFGSFGFLQVLDHGKSVDDVLGPDCEEPIFMMNPLVLQFCLWLLTTDSFENPQDILDKLAFCAAERINFRTLIYKQIVKKYPAMYMRSFSGKNSLKVDFLRRVFEKCKHVLVLHTEESTADEFEDIVAPMIPSLLNQLTVLSIGPYLLPHVGSGNDFTIAIYTRQYKYYHEILLRLDARERYSNVMSRNPQVRARIQQNRSHDLCQLMERKHINQLHLIVGESDHTEAQKTLSALGEFPFCSQFTHFIAVRCHIDDSVPAAFMKAVKKGKFPNLRRIELIRCTLNDCEWPEVPEFFVETKNKCNTSASAGSSAWSSALSPPPPPEATSQMQKLISNLTELTVNESFDRIISGRLDKLSVSKLILTMIQSQPSGTKKLQHLNCLLRQGHFPNLSKLYVTLIGEINMRKMSTFLQEFDPNSSPKLEKVVLERFFISTGDLDTLSEKLSSSRLTELNLSLSYGMTGCLSSLFTHSFPTLNTLILISCELNSEDLVALSQANVEGKLPQLRHLDISLVKVSDLFTHSAQWNQLTSLCTTDPNILNIEPSFLTSLEELTLNPTMKEIPTAGTVTRHWFHLRVIHLCLESVLPRIAHGVERGMFPSLTTLRLGYRQVNPDQTPSLFKLYKANVFVQGELLDGVLM